MDVLGFSFHYHDSAACRASPTATAAPASRRSPRTPGPSARSWRRWRSWASPALVLGSSLVTEKPGAVDYGREAERSVALEGRVR